MSDENVPFLSPFNVSWLESSSSLSGLSVNQSRRQYLTTNLNINKCLLYFSKRNIPLCFHTREVYNMFFSVYNTFPHASFLCTVPAFFGKHICFSNTHSCFHKQEASCMFYTVYNCFPCTVFLSKIIVNFHSWSEKFQIHEYYIGYIGLDMLAVELPQLLHYPI